MRVTKGPGLCHVGALLAVMSFGAGQTPLVGTFEPAAPGARAGQAAPARSSDADRWNRILSDPNSTFFNRQPNEFLTRVAGTLKKGRALDVGMGQGRNAVWLATQGWQVTGFDPATDAVAVAVAEAKRAGVPLTAVVQTDDAFEWGRGRWDLILMSYVDVRTNAKRAIDALAPGGVVIVEGTHRDTLKLGVRIGEAVLFGDNELIQLFAGLRVLRYEDVLAPSDFGEPTVRGQARTVRLLAQKVER